MSVTVTSLLLGLAAVGIALWPQLCRAAERHFVKALTVLHESDLAGLPREGPKLKGTAVVAGGSQVNSAYDFPGLIVHRVAGLITARILSTHYEHVTLVEPDEDEKGRSHVPQFHQLHAFVNC
jgi:hypothetical protein